MKDGEEREMKGQREEKFWRYIVWQMIEKRVCRRGRESVK
jgi:hypothetical protein